MAKGRGPTPESILRKGVTLLQFQDPSKKSEEGEALAAQGSERKPKGSREEVADKAI